MNNNGDKNNSDKSRSDINNEAPLNGASFNDNLSAKPKTSLSAEENATDFSEMNVKDAKDLGYTDEKGEAVSKSKKDEKGSPTGAFTDVGEGRSSVVKQASKTDADDHPERPQSDLDLSD